MAALQLFYVCDCVQWLYLFFLPFHHPSVGSVSVLEAYLNPELDHLHVLRKSFVLLVYGEAWSPGTMS
jgi:hypothetical protein